MSIFQTLCLFQVIYFQACELVLLSGHQKATYLYTLMFYNVVSYCSSYVKEVYERRNWSPYVTITERSQVKHLGMSATKLTLEWTKVNNIINLCIFTVFENHSKKSHFDAKIQSCYDAARPCTAQRRAMPCRAITHSKLTI